VLTYLNLERLTLFDSRPGASHTIRVRSVARRPPESRAKVPPARAALTGNETHDTGVRQTDILPEGKHGLARTLGE
jgi:hypothetical protein